MPQPANPRQTRFEVFCARLSLELTDTRKSRPKALCRRLNGNEINLGQLRKLSPGPGVLPRPIERIPQREDPPPGGVPGPDSSVPAGNGPKSPFLAHRRGGRVFVGARAVVRQIALTTYLSFSSRHPQYSHSNHVSAARPRSSFGNHRIGVHCPHLAQNASGSSGAGMRRTFGSGGEVACTHGNDTICGGTGVGSGSAICGASFATGCFLTILNRFQLTLIGLSDILSSLQDGLDGNFLLLISRTCIYYFSYIFFLCAFNKLRFAVPAVRFSF